MPYDIDWNLLARYLADECTPEEARRVDAWVQADPTRQGLMKELRDIWHAAGSSGPSVDPVDLTADWDRLAKTLDAAEASSPSHERETRPGRPARPPRRRSRSTPLLQRALYVVLAGLMLVSSLWLGLDQWAGMTPTASAPPFREVITERGERATVQLVDGTEVTLNVDSRLRLPTAFDGERRAVYLDGEAYFDVATDSARPFIVYAKDAVINVHGTAFNVRSYPEEPRVQVAVVEGSVSLQPQQPTPAPKAGARLQPGEIGQLANHSTHVATRRAENLQSMLGWMDGHLVFQNAPLTEVVNRLERWYNLQFKIADPALDSLRLTANLKSRSVRNVLDAITPALGIRYRIHQTTVVLTDDTPRLPDRERPYPSPSQAQAER